MKEVPKNEQCPHCGRYANRGVSVDAVIIRNQKVLLVKRGFEPFKGFWATPGGFIEWDESTEDAVVREVKEETGLTATNCRLVAVQSKPERHPQQVMSIIYLIDVASTDAVAGDDAEEVQWFSIDSLSEELAFDHRQIIDDALAFRDGQ